MKAKERSSGVPMRRRAVVGRTRTMAKPNRKGRGVLRREVRVAKKMREQEAGRPL